MAPADYVRLIEKRFANAAIRDTTRRVAFDGSSRHAGFVLPILRDALDAGAALDGLALAEALWARMCAGRREDGSAIAPNDPEWDGLTAAALKARERPAAWLEQTNIYGALASETRFSTAFEAWLRHVWAEGVSDALALYARR
jgi:mannitol 2-dehydrogenase